MTTASPTATKAVIVTGTDTEIGKTVFAAALAGALGASYWKPVQAGVEPEDPHGETDALRVASLSDLPRAKILPEAYRLATPCSPHLAARIDGVEIEAGRLALPAIDGPLVIEGAGGVHVPLSETETYADQFQRWGAPVVLVARTMLGTINHALLSLEALRARDIPVLGIAFVGDAQEESERIIASLGKVRRLGRLPRLDPLTPAGLRAAFAQNFNPEDFLA